MSAEDRKRVSVLSHKRGAIKGRLTSFKKFLDEYNPNTDAARLRVRIEKLDAAFASFDDIQTELEMLDTDNDRSSERAEILDEYYDHLAIAQTLLQPPGLAQCASTLPCLGSGNSGITPPPGIVADNASSIKLPKINIPAFDGSLEKWLSFRNSFCSMIESKSGLANVDKLHYLRSFLTGEALDTIESLELTDANYSEAWQLLNDTYDNKRVIILRHSYLLLNLAPVPKDSASGLRDLINNATQHLRSLKALGEPVEQWSTLLVTTVQSKLDSKLLREWESTSKNDVVPSFDSLIAFLRKVASRLQSSVPSVASDTNTKARSNSKAGLITSVSAKRKNFSVSVNKCPVCSETHSIANCKQFLKLSVAERINTARRGYLCLNCLRGGHRTLKCKAAMACEHCSKRHNSLLHLVKETEKTSDSPEL